MTRGMTYNEIHNLLKGSYNDLALPLIQGEYFSIAANAELVLQKNKKTLLAMNDLYECYVENSGEKYNVNEVVGLLATHLGGDTEGAFDIVHMLDLNEMTKESAYAIGRAYTQKPASLQALRDKRECVEGLQEMLVEEGGVGVEQARLLVSRFEKSVCSLINEHLGKSPSAQR